MATEEDRIAALAEMLEVDKSLIFRDDPEDAPYYDLTEDRLHGARCYAVVVDGHTSRWLVATNEEADKVAREVVWSTLADDPGDSLTHMEPGAERLPMRPLYSMLQAVGREMAMNGATSFASLNDAIKYLLDLFYHGGFKEYANTVLEERGRAEFLGQADCEEHDLGEGLFAYQI